MPRFQFDSANVTKQGKPSTSAGTEYVDAKVKEFREANAHKTILTESEYLQIDRCLSMLHRRPAIFDAVTRSQKEVTIEGTIAGIEFKGRIDMLLPDAILDLKSTKDCRPAFFAKDFMNFHYGPKLAIYRELVRQNTVGVREVKVITQETSGDYDNCIYMIPDYLLDYELTRVLELVERYKACLESDQWPGVDNNRDELELSIPGWYLSKIQDEREIVYDGL
jgi:hypothetical protein